MHSLLLSIALFPHYAVIAAVVIIAHWVWLFGFNKPEKQSLQPSLSGIEPTEEDQLTEIAASDSEEDTILSSSASQQEDEALTSSGYYTSNDTLTEEEHSNAYLTSEEGLEQSTSFFPLAQQHQALMDQYAGHDILPLLQRLEEGTLSEHHFAELETLIPLTLEVEQQFPYAVDLV